MERKKIYISARHSGIDKNVTPLVADALDELLRLGGGELCFEKGEYHFYEQGAIEQFYGVSNNSAGMKKIAFSIVGFDGLTIDGGDSVFVFHEKVFPFVVSHSSHIVLRNIIFDRILPASACFQLCQKSEQGFVLQIDEDKVPYTVKDGAVYFHRENKDFTTAEKKLGLHRVGAHDVMFLFVGDTTDSTENLPAPHMLTDAKKVDGGIYFHYRKDTPSKCHYQEGDQIHTVLDGGRDIDLIFLNQAQNILIKDVTVRRGIGMGLIAQLSENVELDGFCTDVEHYGELSTLTADSMHFVNCRGYLNIHDCSISHTMDDVINVHGMYTSVIQADSTKMVVGIMHQEQAYFAPYISGDILHVIDPKTLDIVARYCVKTISLSEDGRSVELNGEFEGNFELVKSGFLVENPNRMPDLHLHHNHFSHFPRIRLSGGGEILVEHNTIEYCCSALYAVDLQEYWYESGRIKNLVFRNNHLDNCNSMGDDSFITIAVSGFDGSNTPKVHEKIEILDNTARNIKNNFVVADGVKELVMRGNVC